MAKLIETNHSKVDLDAVLDLNAYMDDESALPMPEQLRSPAAVAGNNEKSHHLDQSVLTVTVELEQRLNMTKVEDFLEHLLWEKDITNQIGEAMDILRLKGLVVAGSNPDQKKATMIQAVHEIYDKSEVTLTRDANRVTNRFIFIGRHLDKAVLLERLEKCT